MSKTDVSLDLWRKLYDVASNVKALAPWSWMEETDIFGVEMPESGDLIFVTVMGAIGEHFAIAVHPGVASLTALLALHHDENAIPEQILEIPQIQLSFEDREFLEPEDRRVIKQLGLNFRGKHAWPQFRSYRPGFAPWFLDKDEAAMMELALHQLLDVGPLIAADPSIVQSDNPQIRLVRAFKRGSDGDQWEDEVRNIPLVDISVPRFVPGADIVRQCLALPRVDTGVEVDLFLVPAPIGEKNVRPFFPYAFLMVESKNGSIVGQELLTMQDSMNNLLRSIPAKLIDQFKRLGVRPARVIVRPGRFADILGPTCEAVGVELRIQRQLPHLELAREGMIEFLARGPG